MANQGILKGEVSLYCYLLFDWFGISYMIADIFIYLQNRLIQTSQIGGQRYSDTSPISIPWSNYLLWRNSAAFIGLKNDTRQNL